MKWTLIEAEHRVQIADLQLVHTGNEFIHKGLNDLDFRVKVLSVQSSNYIFTIKKR